MWGPRAWDRFLGVQGRVTRYKEGIKREGGEGAGPSQEEKGSSYLWCHPANSMTQSQADTWKIKVISVQTPIKQA